MPPANLNWIQLQLLRNLVEMHFQCVTRLRCTVPPFWTARGLVGKRSQSLKFVARHVIRNGLERTGIKRTRHSVTAVCTTVQIGLKVHGGDGAVILYAR